MYVFYLEDGTVIGTTSKAMISYIRETYDVGMESFIENLDTAMEVVNSVIE